MTRLGAGALIWAGFDGETAPGAILDAIERGAIGGVLLFAVRGNVRSKDQTREMLREIQDATRRGRLPPVPVGIDQEGGSVVRITYRPVFPSAMAIAATGDPAYAERAGRAVAELLRVDGIAVNHAPVCDVNVEPRNPVIGTRSFGDDAARVAAFAAAWVRGSEGAGVATTPKHFPGHGEAPVDSHFTTVDVRADRHTLETRDLAPFRAALAAGASALMAAHVRYPALDEDNIATLSPKILIDLLRKELGFTGLVITDSLDMSGIGLIEPSETVVARAVNAGVDAVMVTSGVDKQLAAAERIATGVRAPRVLEAVRRAARFRERFGVAVPEGDIDETPHRALAAEIAARSITLLGGPLRPWTDGPPGAQGPIRVSAFSRKWRSPAEEPGDRMRWLEDALRRRFGSRLVFARDGAMPEGTGNARRNTGPSGGTTGPSGGMNGPVIVCTVNAAFDAEQAAHTRELLRDGGVLCALGSPYDAAVIAHRPALLSYGDVPASLDALAAVLAGDRPATGVCPVRLVRP